jgi:hypothetical protein
VLKPGGLLVITDSIQLGDRPGNDERELANFDHLNEPHYREYTTFSFGDELRRVGLKPEFKSMMFLSKTISAIKPFS